MEGRLSTWVVDFRNPKSEIPQFVSDIASSLSATGCHGFGSALALALVRRLLVLAQDDGGVEAGHRAW